MTDSCGPQITQNLRSMNGRERFAGFDFEDHSSFDQQIRDIIPQSGSILIKDGYSELALDCNTVFFQTMGQAVFINLFQMSPFEKGMQ